MTFKPNAKIIRGCFLYMAAAVFLAVVCLTAWPNNVRAEDSPATKLIKARSAEFKEEIIKVANNVYTAIGYDVSTVSMIVGTDGVIIVDTGQTPARGAKILAEFRKISDKPIKAVIFTHGHPDHTGGANAFVEDGNPEIWARDNFGAEENTFGDAGLKIQFRAIRQTGFKLPAEKRINQGIAPAMWPAGPPKPAGSAPTAGPPAGASGIGAVQVKPTKTFSGDRQELDIAGVKLELVADAGETYDQLYVWMPDKKIVFSGDNFYKSFPNLYAIRGVPYRDVRSWGEADDKMLKEGPEILVPGHTRPIIGKEAVAQALTDYRDAIRFVFQKTIEGINKGLTPDQLVVYVKLPPELASKDYLIEFYGRVDWAVRSIFNGYLGWFDGNATTLVPLPPKEEALRMADMAGGPDALMKRAKAALAKGDFQWAAQLIDHLIALDPTAAESKNIKADALDGLAEQQISTIGRNYYYTYAQDLREEIAKAQK